MNNQMSEAGKITAKVREIAKGDTVFNDFAVISQDLKHEFNRTVEKITVTIPGKIDSPSVNFSSELNKFKKGGASFSFDYFGTEDLNVFIDILKTFD